MGGNIKEIINITDLPAPYANNPNLYCI